MTIPSEMEEIPEEKSRMFLSVLMQWHLDHPRDMPWKKTTDPYRIWLSEMILQQTQVRQGIPYYLKFLKLFPDVHALANASEDAVLKAWQGLGYNSRARYLHQTAIFISQQCDGRFPDTIEDLKALKGVGSYTAAAIGSFAFGISEPVIDGNVYRVMSRFFGFTDRYPGKRLESKVSQIAKLLIRDADPAEYNQALMNFGALQCTPRSPDCQHCPLSSHCFAYIHGMVSTLPRKAPGRPRKRRIFHYFVCIDHQKILLRKRRGRDIWRNMYDFPALEPASLRTLPKSQRRAFLKDLLQSEHFVLHGISDWYTQTLTHRVVKARFEIVHIKGDSNVRSEDCYSVPIAKLEQFAFPKIVDLYIRGNSIILNQGI